MPLITYPLDHGRRTSSATRSSRRRFGVQPKDGRWPSAVHLAARCTAYLYDWNMLPIGQLLWEKELLSYKEFPPLQAPETYNLDGILKAVQQSSTHPSE